MCTADKIVIRIRVRVRGQVSISSRGLQILPSVGDTNSSDPSGVGRYTNGSSIRRRKTVPTPK